MKSLVVKRSIVIHGHKTSVSLEDAFWRALKELAATDATTLSDLVGKIANSRAEAGNLSSGIRVHVLGCFRDKAAARMGNSVTPGVVPVQSAPASATTDRRPDSTFAR
jgi:predicted DNA-binding ribbon-helix-helix protein